MSSEGIIKLQKHLFSHTILWDLRLFSVETDWWLFRLYKSPWCFDVIPHDNAISRIYFFFLSIQDIKINCYIIFFQFFPNHLKIFPDGKFIFSQIYLFMKGLIFAILSECFSICSWFNAIVAAYWKHLLSFLLIGFIAAFLFLLIQQNLCIILQDSNLFHDIYNTVNEHNLRQTH